MKASDLGVVAQKLGHDAGIVVGLVHAHRERLERTAKHPARMGIELRADGAAKGIEPTDEVEAMMAAMMAVTFRASMKYGKRLEQSDTLLQAESADKIFNKLARTYAAQVEALKRYRSDGSQKVVVKHVTVNEGGQAVVGSVETRGVQSRKMAATP